MHAFRRFAGRARLALLLLGLTLLPPATLRAADSFQVELRYRELDAFARGAPPGKAGTAGELFADFRRPGWDLLAEPGAPALPCRAEQIVLPPGTMATAVHATSLAATRIPAPEIPPAQPPAILGPAGVTLPAPGVVPPDPAVYAGAALYPAELAVFRGSGHFAELGIAACELHPIQYDPQTREIVLHHEIALTVDLAPDPNAWTKQGASGRERAMDRITRAIAERSMRGSENIVAKDAATGRAQAVDPAAYEYVIVTHEGQIPAYNALAAWKTAKGIPATVVGTAWILENFTGRDTAAKIRSFVAEAVRNWGTSYVLLAGDQWLVPSRPSFAFDCRARLAYDENDLYADLYYSDLDGSWEANRNGIYGEVSDGVDLYPDVLVGRSPTNDIFQASAIVQKFINYDRNIAADQSAEVLFFAEVLWTDPFTDAGVGKDMIADAHLGSFPGPVTRLYETLGNESSIAVTQALNAGPLLANHDGHAYHNVMSCGQGYLRNADADHLMNGARTFVMFSIGCWAAAFDYDSIAEHFVRNGSGGAVAFIGNSRYGWGSPGNPGWGYSETFDSDFYGAIFTEGLTELGAAVAWPKVLRIPFSQDANVYRWHQYQVNLLGDPEMMCHTAETIAMSIEAPAVIPVASSEFTATVRDASGPIAGARLCLAGESVYQVGVSDAAGQVVFAPEVPAAAALTLTATAANHTYAEAAITAGEAPLIAVAQVRIDDDERAPSAGNGDGEVESGETIEIALTVANRGSSGSSDLRATLPADNPALEILAAETTFGDVPAGGEATNADPLVVRVTGEGPAQAVYVLPIDFRDGEGRESRASIPIDVVAPGTRLDEVAVAVVVGDTDAVVEPGETVALSVTVKNTGRGRAGATNAVLRAESAGIRVTRSLATATGDLAPGEVATLTPSFEVTIDEACAIPACVPLVLELDDGQRKQGESIHIAIGEAGVATTVERDAGGWTLGEPDGQWRRTTNRHHSGETSWYCGTDDFQYANDSEWTLLSPEFVVPPDAEITFWCYFDVTIYGTDGLYVEALDGDEWRILYYLGSGGALDPLLFACRWAEHRLTLSLAPGTQSQLRFRFKSDARETAEGFYVDDVSVHARTALAVSAPALDRPLAVTAAAANPIEGGGRWRVSLAAPAQVTARLYDVNGRLLRELARMDAGAGVHELRWDGTTGWGQEAPSGIYFLRVEAGGREAITKVVKLPE